MASNFALLRELVMWLVDKAFKCEFAAVGSDVTSKCVFKNSM